MTLVYNCNEDVVAAAFISRLHVTNPFYKHLVKNEIIRMRDILLRAQNYIKIEEATPTMLYRSSRQGPETEKLKPQFPLRKNLSHNSSAVCKPSRRAAKSSKGGDSERDLTPFRVSINQIFNALKTSLGSGVWPDLSLLTNEGQGLVTSAHSMMGGATSRWTVGPYDDTPGLGQQGIPPGVHSQSQITLGG